MKTKFEAIFCIVNEGFADEVIFAARKAGASGATIIKGHGSSGREAQEIFNIEIQPQKEIIMMVVPAEMKDAVLLEMYNSAGLDTKGQGIAFSLPVAGAVGLKDFSDENQAGSAGTQENK